MSELPRVMSTSIPPVPERTTMTRWRDDWMRELREAVAPEGMREDVLAALVVACVAVPLSMAIALASDVAPIHGLIAAVVGGVVASLFGSSRLSVTGPAAAMAVLVGQVVDAHGLPGLFIVTLAAGAMQVATGLFGFGSIARLVPSSVVHGFTAGIGVVILVGQLPRALGLPAPDESHALGVLSHVGDLLHHVNPAAAGIAAMMVGMMVFGPRLSPKVPFAILGVVAATALVRTMGLDVPVVGELPAITEVRLPGLPPMSKLPVLLGDAFAVFALASLETLLSISSLEKIRPGEKHDPNHELVGQGLANVASGLALGIPVTGVIARSALNAQSGARTRRAAFLHAVFLALALVFARPYLGAIPVAALGGVLLATGLRMLDLGYLRHLLAEHKADAGIFLVTAGVMVASDLLVGVQAGLLAACIVTLVRLTRTSIRLVPAHGDEPHHVLVDGTATFLAIPKLDTLAQRMNDIDAAPGLIVDVRHLDAMDRSAAEHLATALGNYVERGGKVVVLGPRASVGRALDEALPREVPVVLTERDADAHLGRVRTQSGRRRIAEGLARYRRDVRPGLSPLTERLAAGQSPHTMIITCADSRVVPSMITGTGPGELFVVRNIGALLPPAGHDTLNDEGAGLEYAIRVLGVRHIVVCAHSKCGAMNALASGQVPSDLHALSQWLEGARSIAGHAAEGCSVDEYARSAALRQVEHVRSYPVVQAADAAEGITVDAWFFDVETADVRQWNTSSQSWEALG